MTVRAAATASPPTLYAQAYKSMADLYGVPNPNGNNPQAYPIVMSAADAFPANPDASQTVQCDRQPLGSGSTPPVNPSEPPASELAVFDSVSFKIKALNYMGFYIYYALTLEDEARYRNYSSALIIYNI